MIISPFCETSTNIPASGPQMKVPVALRAEGIVFGEVCDAILCSAVMFPDQIYKIRFVTLRSHVKSLPTTTYSSNSFEVDVFRLTYSSNSFEVDVFRLKFIPLRHKETNTSNTNFLVSQISATSWTARGLIPISAALSLTVTLRFSLTAH